MKQWLRGYACRDRRRVEQQLAEWYAGQPGQTLAATEQALIDSVLPNLFGYHLLQLGSVVPCDLLSASRIPHRMVMVEGGALAWRRVPEVGLFRGESEQLPVESSSIDVVLCPHILEFASSPHAVLREVERVLIPEGHLVIVSFNPWSLWGLARLLLGWKRQAPWCGRFYSRGRLQDWLALLGFETVVTRTAFFRLPLSYPGLLQRFEVIERSGSRWWPALGGVHMVVAKKRVATLTPIKPRWRPRRSLLQGKLPEATLRRENE